jgi:SAM-dependent methyltransferase
MVNRRARRRRMKLLMETFAFAPSMRVLDVGGTVGFWVDGAPEADITLLNLDVPEIAPDGFRVMKGDATELSFPDGSFDIVFSNSVIEHLGTPERQRQMAREVQRVGGRLWVQTPSRHFPIEPHYLTPIVHWLPRSIRKKLLRNFSVWGLLTRPSNDEVAASVDEIRLLDHGEMELLFPGCEIVHERFMGMTKSLIAIRRTTT